MRKTDKPICLNPHNYIEDRVYFGGGVIQLYQALTSLMGIGFFTRRIIQKVGDRDKSEWSIKDYAFTIPSNPMSDRVQMVIEIYECDSDCRRTSR